MIDAATRRQVAERARNRCEYCGLFQAELTFAVFHIEHIIARKHGGSDDPDNLALACYHCNWHKGTNLTGIDPETEAIVRLFHPRRDVWQEHFVVRDFLVVGLSPIGRVTVRVLDMNAVDHVQMRVAADDPQHWH